jgi:hypothetical protein
MLMYSDTIRSAALASVREENDLRRRNKNARRQETIEGPEFTDGCSRTGTRPVVGASGACLESMSNLCWELEKKVTEPCIYITL